MSLTQRKCTTRVELLLNFYKHKQKYKMVISVKRDSSELQHRTKYRNRKQSRYIDKAWYY